MSAEETRKVVSRAVLEEEFRQALFSDPDQVLSEYNLTPEEREALRSIPVETMDQFAVHLEERISMSLFAYGAELIGGQASGSDNMGGVAIGSETGGEGSAKNWLQRLAAAMGIRGGSGGRGDYY